MAILDWEKFKSLSGAQTENFETLCRSLIRRHYAKFGMFFALANQPGVEFHIQFTEKCDLANAGDWFGWQCRWYDLASGRSIGSARKTKIIKSIEKTKEVIPNITDWVLWTRKPLSAGDQDWYHDLDYNIKLHLWDESEIREHLTGEAEIFYSSYFGNLILTNEMLRKLHERSVSPIKNRWIPETHQVVNAERRLRKILGEEKSWRNIDVLAKQLLNEASEISDSCNDLEETLRKAVLEISTFAVNTSNILKQKLEQLQYGNFDYFWDNGPGKNLVEDNRLFSVQHTLRSKRHPISLLVSNILASIKNAKNLIEELHKALNIRLVAVVAKAGCGKTQLSAQLTMNSVDRPAGIYISGRDLNSRQCLDDLAHRISINGTLVESMESLIAALDSAGQRSKRRIPIVIDGLNEAEDPRDWKPLLQMVESVLKPYPWVVLVCTIRSEFANYSLPSKIDQFEIPHFQDDTDNAIKQYFEYYKIDPADAELALELLKHPLTLRLFCEVINPKRKEMIKIEGMVSSLTDLFEKYLELAYERIGELSPITQRYLEQDVRAAINKIGLLLWNKNERVLNSNFLRKELNDEKRNWNESLLSALEQEGIILQIPGYEHDCKYSMVVFDALAGHLIAKSILSIMGESEFDEWIKKKEVVDLLAGPLSKQHPLANDILIALVGLVPRTYFRSQLWQLSKEPIKSRALLQTVYLDGKYLDSASVKEIENQIFTEPENASKIFERLMETRGIDKHPLNGYFLNRLLGEINASKRDLCWTEWIRSKRNMIIEDLKRLEWQWRKKNKIDIQDLLRAKWVMWLLTSTSREIRDQASYSLYWFGRIDSGKLFDLAIFSLGIDDDYVTERMFAISYGLAMAKQFPDSNYLDCLKSFLVNVRDELVGKSAANPTNHYLIRLYIQGIVELAFKFYPDVIPHGLENNKIVAFSKDRLVEKIAKSDSRRGEICQILNMDFENYTLGRLFKDRHNYQVDHPGHVDAVSYILGVAWDLGWREKTFEKVEESIQRHFYTGRTARAKIERYGKKYCWIGFYRYAGKLFDDGNPPYDGERLSDVGIDPSFPEPPPRLKSEKSLGWIQKNIQDNEEWIVNGTTIVTDEIFYREKIQGIDGPWIAIQAYLKKRDIGLWRNVYGFVEGFLVKEDDTDTLIDLFRNAGHPEIWGTGRLYGEYYTFAGEIPWSSEFGKIAFDGNIEKYYKRNVDEEINPTIIIETLSHSFSWERHHCRLNNAGEVIVPSKKISDYFALRGKPQTFNQFLNEEEIATFSLRAPKGYLGEILYIREDLIRDYSKNQSIVWLCWGERELENRFDDLGIETQKAIRNYENLWRFDRKLEDLLEERSGNNV